VGVVEEQELAPAEPREFARGRELARGLVPRPVAPSRRTTQSLPSVAEVFSCLLPQSSLGSVVVALSACRGSPHGRAYLGAGMSSYNATAYCQSTSLETLRQGILVVCSGLDPLVCSAAETRPALSWVGCHQGQRRMCAVVFKETPVCGRCLYLIFFAMSSCPFLR